MNVTAALAWWNEQPEDLARCVKAAGNVADRIVAIDGAYARYPGGTPQSNYDQVDAIKWAAKEANLECLILQPQRLWKGQIEKRSYLLSAAAYDSAWVAVIDADHIIHTDREKAREELASTDGDVMSVAFHTPVEVGKTAEEKAPSDWHIAMAEGTTFHPHILRALPGMQVETRHWWISANKDGHKVWYWHDTEPTLKHVGFATPYYIEHRVLLRSDDQIKASRAFINDRIRVMHSTGQEDDRPGLPEPEFDYERRPVG